MLGRDSAVVPAVGVMMVWLMVLKLGRLWVRILLIMRLLLLLTAVIERRGAGRISAGTCGRSSDGWISTVHGVARCAVLDGVLWGVLFGPEHFGKLPRRNNYRLSTT